MFTIYYTDGPQWTVTAEEAANILRNTAGKNQQTGINRLCVWFSQAGAIFGPAMMRPSDALAMLADHGYTHVKPF
jgi:hypothetical protein